MNQKTHIIRKVRHDDSTLLLVCNDCDRTVQFTFDIVERTGPVPKVLRQGDFFADHVLADTCGVQMEPPIVMSS